jgi:2-polyprenyl-3-methyl-5-hydroxy-6-metoxy-1,4-benzoquinol methylase
VTGTAKTTRDYAQEFCKQVLKKEGVSLGYVLELASNDGTFLKPFMDEGYKVLGIDPAKNIVETANKNGVPTICEFFGTDKVTKLQNKYGLARVVIVRNVLPHVENLHSFVEGMQLMLAENGLLVLEFHYAKEILTGLHYDSIYHEHLHYFSLKSVEKLLHQHNLYVEDIGISPINTKGLVLYIRRGKIKEKKVVQKYRDMENKLKVNTLKSWQKFTGRAIEHREELRWDVLGNLLLDEIIGYGSSARSSTLLNFCGFELLSIADDNPIKQGLYTAGTHILIESSKDAMEHHPKYILILAWNFASEIVKSVREKYHYKGKFIIPLPKIKII